MRLTPLMVALVMLAACGGAPAPVAETAAAAIEEAPLPSFEPMEHLPRGTVGLVELRPNQVLASPYWPMVQEAIQQSGAVEQPSIADVAALAQHIDQVFFAIVTDGSPQGAPEPGLLFFHGDSLTMQDIVGFVDQGGGGMTPGTVAGHPAIGTPQIAIVQVESGWWAMGPRPSLEEALPTSRQAPVLGTELWSTLAGAKDASADISLIYAANLPAGSELPPSLAVARGGVLNASFQNGLQAEVRVEFADAGAAQQAVVEAQAELDEALGSPMAAMAGFDVLRTMIALEAAGTQGRGSLNVPDAEFRTLFRRLLMMVGAQL